jgi:hypothetical protein
LLQAIAALRFLHWHNYGWLLPSSLAAGNETAAAFGLLFYCLQLFLSTYGSVLFFNDLAVGLFPSAFLSAFFFRCFLSFFLSALLSSTHFFFQAFFFSFFGSSTATTTYLLSTQLIGWVCSSSSFFFFVG